MTGIEWNFDVIDAPRDNCEQILVAVKDTKRLKVTWWAWQDYTKREGGWVGLLPGQEVLAWSRLKYPVTRSEQPVSLPFTPPVALPPGVV